MFESPSISRFKNSLFFITDMSSLKVIYSAIIIEALLICLFTTICMIPLVSLITHPEALLFSILEPSNSYLLQLYIMHFNTLFYLQPHFNILLCMQPRAHMWSKYANEENEYAMKLKYMISHQTKL